MKQIKSKFMNRRFGGWQVVKVEALNGGNHKLFTLKWTNGKTSKYFTARDNDLTALANGTLNISNLSAYKDYIGELKTIKA